MNPDLMTVLSMRQKEMSYHQLARSASASFFEAAAAATAATAAPLMTPPLVPQSPVPTGFGVPGMPRGCISPDSVQQLPYSLSLQTPVSASYEQFGFVWHWVMETATHFALQRQTAHFANQYAQVLLRRRAAQREQNAYALRSYEDVFAVQRELRVLGLGCVFMAAKIEEVHPPKAAELAAFISERGGVQLAADDLSRLEVEYVAELQWNLHPTTPYSWLLFMVAGGSADQRPLDTMGDFVNPARNPSGTKELFVNAIRLVDIGLLDYQAIEYWPSVLAGAALLLVDPQLDFLFVAQFLQLDPNVLWECKTWLYTLAYSVCELEATATQSKERWAKVPAEELLFIQSPVVVPSHLACGLLRADVATELYPGTPLGKASTLDACPSPCSPSDNFAMTSSCMCKGDFHTCGGSTPGPHVYHFKYGWQGIDTGLLAPIDPSHQQLQRMQQYP